MQGRSNRILELNLGESFVGRWKAEPTFATAHGVDAYDAALTELNRNLIEQQASWESDSSSSQKRTRAQLNAMGMAAEHRRLGKVERADFTDIQLSSYCFSRGLILNLRQQYRAKNRGHCSLKEFHMDLLSIDSLPLRYTCEILLGNEK